jgi:hypothetical protein
MNRLNLLPIGALAAAGLLAACGSGPVKNPQAGRIRSELSAIEADPALASRAPIAIKDAEAAVAASEQPQSNPALSEHLAYIADRKVKLARAQAEARLADDRLRGLLEPAPVAAPAAEPAPPESMPEPAPATPPTAAPN